MSNSRQKKIEPLLLTPGPLTTNLEVRKAMLTDWGSRDVNFQKLSNNVRIRLLNISSAESDYTCVPLQGSGTFAVEAALHTFTKDTDVTLILSNGAYGARAEEIQNRLGRRTTLMQFKENQVINPNLVEEKLLLEKNISNVFLVHCETTTGILNPLDEISKIVRKYNKTLFLDAMSTFGGIPINLKQLPIDVLIASSNKCLEGVPGIGFVIANKQIFSNSIGNAKTLSLDLADQWLKMERSSQWRFTPPTHVMAALSKALDLLEDEGGVAGRFARYWENSSILIEGMTTLGFTPLLSNNIQSPIIVTFKELNHQNYNFDEFYFSLQRRGYTIYPGKLTNVPSFRVGCIGHIKADDMKGFISATRETLNELNIK